MNTKNEHIVKTDEYGGISVLEYRNGYLQIYGFFETKTHLLIRMLGNEYSIYVDKKKKRESDIVLPLTARREPTYCQELHQILGGGNYLLQFQSMEFAGYKDLYYHSATSVLKE